MSAPTWVTVVAFDTPFLAQLAAERLREQGIPSRLLSDSGGETLPHVSFATGGYRVQIAREDADAARAALSGLDDLDLTEIDVGEFGDEDGVQPPQALPTEQEPASRSPSPLVVVGVIAVIVGVVMLSFRVLTTLL